MKALQLFGLTALGIAMLGVGNVLAGDLPPSADFTPVREQMQERMRSMTPEELQLMRETSSDRRAQMESKQSSRSDGSRGGGRGKGGGRKRSANGEMAP